MNSSELKNWDKEYIVGTYARYNLVAESGKHAVCTDTDGREYIDFTSGIGVNSLGFTDEGWVNAVKAQLDRIQHTSNLYYTQPQIVLAEALVGRTGMKKAFFCNSGAEANEAAIKTARKYGGRADNTIITLNNSFHGRTMATITATGQEHYHQYFNPFLDGFRYCDANDTAGLEELVDDSTCAIMMELVQGEGGVLNLEKDFVKAAERIAADNNLLLVIDEVQTGIGRTGKFFAYEHFDIKPDIVTFAKGIGGGLPVGGVLFSDRCCDVLKPGDHGTTFGGNPVCCAGAVEVVSRIDDDFLAEVAAKGEYIRKKVSEMNGVAGISGLGLMIGIKPADKKAGDVVAEALEKGLMLLTAKDRVRMLPPLNISYEEIDRGLAILEDCLK